MKLGIQYCNGFSDGQIGPLAKLVKDFDNWLEYNYHIPNKVVLSFSFYKRLSIQIGYSITTLDTVIGEFPVEIADQVEDVLIF